MSYQALYRKLRPKTFKDVEGQEHIVRTLQNQITKDHITHAYLFCGTRGTGKTSTAKLFAKAINCFDLQNGEPCNQCKSCLEINNQTSMDVLEIDAASNNSVENIRDIISEVKYAPTVGKYKIYVIDEVHMLSIGAFNALLKTLEEPPAHIIFILATTDPQKIPATILSRCQRFDFKRISTETMALALKNYMLLENREVEEDALLYISSLSDGAMRDALSILDQCISFYFDEIITLDKVLEIVGSVDKSVFDDFLLSIISFDANSCMKQIDNIVLNGKDILQFVQDCIQYMRDILIIKATKGDTLNINMSKEKAKKTFDIYEKIPNDTILKLIKEFSLMSNEVKYANNKRVIFEVNCIKLCSLEIQEDTTALLKRIEKLEEDIKKQPKIIQQVQVQAQVNGENTEEKPVPIREKAIPSDIQEAINNFHNIAQAVDSNSLKNILLKCRPGYIDGNILNLVVNDPTSKGLIENKMDMVKEALTQTYNKDFNVVVKLFDEYCTSHKSTYGVDDETIIKELKEKINFDGIEIID